MAPVARIVCGDGLDPKPSWKGKSAGELSERLGTGIPTMQLRERLSGGQLGVAGNESSPGSFSQIFPTSAPEITAVPCHS